MYWDGGHVESLPVHYNCAVNIHSIHVLASEGTLACVSQVRIEIRNMSSVHSSKYLLIVMHWVCTVCDKTRAPFGFDIVIPTENSALRKGILCILQRKKIQL